MHDNITISANTPTRGSMELSLTRQGDNSSTRCRYLDEDDTLFDGLLGVARIVERFIEPVRAPQVESKAEARPIYIQMVFTEPRATGCWKILQHAKPIFAIAIYLSNCTGWRLVDDTNSVALSIYSHKQIGH